VFDGITPFFICLFVITIRFSTPERVLKVGSLNMPSKNETQDKSQYNHIASNAYVAHGCGKETTMLMIIAHLISHIFIVIFPPCASELSDSLQPKDQVCQ